MSPLLIFDGVCDLCVGSVTFILRHEAAPELQFASAQSAAGTRMLQSLGIDPTYVETLVLIEDGKAYSRSDAAIHVARYLRVPWRWLAALRIVPRFVRDRLYCWIAANRHRWFGRTAECMMPSAELERRFVQESPASRTAHLTNH